MGTVRRYIEQLREDLQQIKSNSTEVLSSYFCEADNETYELISDDEDLGIKIGDLIGIDQVFFPEVDRLKDEEIAMIVSSLKELYLTYGLYPIFEECVTNRIKYGQLRRGLNQKVFPIKDELVDVELCDFLPKDCPLLPYCDKYVNGGECCAERRSRA